MKRRRFFQWLSSVAFGLVAARRARAQPVALSDVDAAQLRDLAAVVLPESLGRARTDDIADRFARWVREYQPGMDMSCGYGHPRRQKVPPSPATHYAEQLKSLETASSAKGATFAKLDAASRREVVEAALQDVKLERVPARPNGEHVAADLMSYFYNSTEGQDYLYGVTIGRDNCRGLNSSGERPKPIS